MEQQCPSLSFYRNKTNLLTDGACNASLTNQCCGRGVCQQNPMAKTPRYVCSCSNGYSGQFCHLDNQFLANFTTDVNYIVEYVKNMSAISSENLNSILNIFDQAVNSEIISNTSASIIIDLLNTKVVPTITDSLQLESVFILIRNLKNLQSDVLSQQQQSDKESSLLNLIQNVVKQYSAQLTEARDQVTINTTGILGKF